MLDQNFLILSLFVPRIAILIWYFNGWFTFHDTLPYWLDFVLSAFLPRILILIWIGTTMGFGGWFIAHLVFAILAYAGGGGAASRSSD